MVHQATVACTKFYRYLRKQDTKINEIRLTFHLVTKAKPSANENKSISTLLHVDGIISITHWFSSSRLHAIYLVVNMVTSNELLPPHILHSLYRLLRTPCLLHEICAFLKSCVTTFVQFDLIEKFDVEVIEIIHW